MGRNSFRNSQVVEDLGKLCREKWFGGAASRLTLDQRRRFQSLLKEFLVRCDDFQFGVSFLEKLQKTSGDEQISRDINAALNQLKTRWNDKDPTSTFERLKGTKKAGKGRDGEYRLFLAFLVIVAIAGFFGVKALFPRLAAHLRPANGFSPPVEMESPNAANVPAPPVAGAQSFELPPADPVQPDRSEEVFRAVSPSIVIVRAHGSQKSQGSGVVVGQGMVVTNRHVVQGASQVTVEAGGAKYPAAVALADPQYDLCALSVTGLQAPIVPMMSFRSLRSGQRVYAVGAPRGLDLSITDGLVSGLRPNGEFPLIQTNAPISPGSSGGGLFDTNGRLVGITTGSLAGGQQLNIAIVSDLISLLPTRSVNIQTLPPAENPRTAQDLSEKPWRDALSKAKEEIGRRQAEFTSCSSTLKTLSDGLNDLQNRMNGLQAARRFSEYNALVPEQNRQAGKIRGMQAECDQKHRNYTVQVDRYNEIVRQFNSRSN